MMSLCWLKNNNFFLNHCIFHSDETRLIDNFNVVSAKFVPVGYGIRKLQIICVVEDDKVSHKDSCLFCFLIFYF